MDETSEVDTLESELQNVESSVNSFKKLYLAGHNFTSFPRIRGFFRREAYDYLWWVRVTMVGTHKQHVNVGFTPISFD